MKRIKLGQKVKDVKKAKVKPSEGVKGAEVENRIKTVGGLLVPEDVMDAAERGGDAKELPDKLFVLGVKEERVGGIGAGGVAILLFR